MQKLAFLLIVGASFFMSCKKTVFLTPTRDITDTVKVNTDYVYNFMVNSAEDEVEMITAPLHADTSEFFSDSTELYPYSYFYSTEFNYTGEDYIEFNIKRQSSADNFDLPKEERVRITLIIE
ncbi:hypothetical protein SAMN05216474_1812 [Lishizhenia tianjinensis]|uniref:Uncharacterized protein n=1 Tax=Lishizhenia tianjinensis TaxID=477690 RepID=A0A1I7A1F0_9FLAO|nr:hypothetical protein [Lishizhenia tianjinensis]SFT68755.1 hypothetical protein SAMN05216474_1812 [Lishizhenia tianjinensis]